ncbi:transglutaminase family protein, partial [Acidithiobacillus ferrooxidans]|nr:transglutaminase family protein [Acidithiobacillus ferrooxidans]
MGIHVVLRHQTVYDFDRLVDIHPHVLRLRPAPHCRTPILAYSLHVEPARHFLNWQQDPFGNYQARLVFPERARSLKVEVEVIADLTVIDPFDFFIEPEAEHWPFPYDPILRKELAPYLEQEEAGPLLRRFLLDIHRQRQRTVDFLVAINQRLQGQIGYTLRMEAGVQTPEETLKKASGSCRDSAWLMVQVLRHMGLAARFVSGYLVQLVADQAPLDGPAGPASDFTDLHAWAEVYVPGAGWIGLDPTSGLFAGEGHIPLACTPHYKSAAPITGATGACEAGFHFTNTVTRLLETPRVTKPYTDGQWEQIMGLGDALDKRLQAADMRLTMGGEPTFVAAEGVDAAEWNQDALGMHKRERAETLVRRLGQRFAPGALLHTGEGKWYPGEPLPRWALGLYWRKDGIPLWREPRLLAEPLHDYGWQADDIHSFACTLTRHLQLDSNRLLPAYEDAWHILHQEGRTPVNIDLSTHRLDDPLERQALIGKLQAGLDQPVG